MSLSCLSCDLLLAQYAIIILMGGAGITLLLSTVLRDKFKSFWPFAIVTFIPMTVGFLPIVYMAVTLDDNLSADWSGKEVQWIDHEPVTIVEPQGSHWIVERNGARYRVPDDELYALIPEAGT